eukprot:TRINITY_DN19399_c0_g1_i3.p1 TRINITY_DN19399_c0_g1~~TRINITY_DN19399_c0_g1_i3.p1  ORF type:complete len:889 (-),score=307.08 TRINITY_DN19399_c0_g1_i3:211-2877(-)
MAPLSKPHEGKKAIVTDETAVKGGKKAVVDVAGGRVIVKNLPKHATDSRLREFFTTVGEVTDVNLRKTKSGVSRQFGFIGFRTAADAQKAIEQLNRSFLDTAKITVEAALAPGSEAISRPWSKHAQGSSAHKKLNPHLYAEEAKNNGSAPKGAIVKTEMVHAEEGMHKAGVSHQRVHMQFGSDEEDEEEDTAATTQANAEPAEKDGAAFDDDLDDIAYLRAKSAKAKQQQSPEAEGAEAEAPTKKKKLKKKGKKAASEGAADAAAAPPADAAATATAAASKAAEDEAVSMKNRLEAAAEADAAEAGATDPAAAAARQELEDSGRLYVTNIPYGATEEELQAHFEPFGEVEKVMICKDEDTLKSRGFGYVTYVFPECGVRALSELELASFQGRLLRVAPAQAKPEKPEDKTANEAEAGKSGKSSYKRQKEQHRKKVEAHQEHTWNLLYVSSNAAADAAAAQLGVKKGELFGKDSENAAVTAALTETSVIQQTKQWLKREGIRVDAFEQTGATLAQAKAAASGENKRREDTFIVKHLPAGASNQELRERFARYGELTRCSLCPAGTVAVVQYSEKDQAKKAFSKLAFSRYKHVPLYLEWAPEDVFDGSGDAPPQANETAGGAVGSRASPKDRAKGEEDDEDEAADDDEATGCLFVKNLNFKTTEAALKSVFGSCKGFRSAMIMKKKAAIVNGKKAEAQSMGYGFLEFDSAASAMEALKRKQNCVVEGHNLNLQLSQRKGGGSRQDGLSKGKKKASALASPRLCVRNLAFEATRKELAQLFGAYGSLTAVRIPKKSDYTGHRGFAFIDFASKSEAAAAFEALQHTHLYGRKLVIEPATEKSTDVEAVQEEAQKRKANLEMKSEAKKRRRAGVLNTSGGAGGSFEEGMEGLR